MADKVLVVDDDKAILTMLHKALKSNGIENDLAVVVHDEIGVDRVGSQSIVAYIIFKA